MDVVKTIDIPDWVRDEATQKVMRAIGGFETPARSMFVGGCVRNLLMGKPISDIDIATQLKPEEVIERLNEAGVKTVPTGIDHGTVSGIVDKSAYEITTLRSDDVTDGRRAVVSFSEDWVEDAERRDFTLNTLLMNCEGQVFDPLSKGLKDLNKSQITFVGNPEKRIQEDYLRILRFFRFYAQYGQGDIDTSGLKACAAHVDQISTLSRERITQEFLKILAVDDPIAVLKIMHKNNVLNTVSDSKYRPETLARLCALQKQYDVYDLMARLFVLAGNKARFFDDYLRLSHVQKKAIVKIDMAVNTLIYSNEKIIKKSIFYHGNDIVLQGYLLSCAIEALEPNDALINVLQNWQAPVCPLNGQTLLDEGYETGPEIGRELEYRIEEWLDETL